ncbi:hypothetical protein BDAP_000013 [Binucleata daphniae]
MELFKIYLAKIALHFVFFVAVYFCNVKSGYFVGSSVILILYNVVPLVYTIRKEKEYEKYHMHKKYYIPKSLFLFFIAIEFVIQIITNIIAYKTYHNDLIIFVCLLHVLLSCFLNFFRNKETKIAKKAKKIGQENKRMLGSIIKDGRYVLKKGENVQLLNVFNDQALVRKFDGEEYLISISMVDSIDKSESSSSNTKK